MGKLNIGPMDMKELLERVNMGMLKYKKPLRTLELEKKDVELKIGDLSTLKNYLNELSSKLTAASTAFNPALIVNSANTSVLTAVASTNTLNATAGNHQINVTQLAQAQSTASVATFTNASVMTAETLTVTMGLNSFSINVAATDTLQDVVNSINTATNNVGVTASTITTDGTNYQLVLSAKNSGAANSFTVSESLGLPQFNISQVIYAAQDAQFKLDNVFTMSRPTNSLSDVISGVTIQLAGLGTTNITTAQDNTKTSANITTAVQNALDSYNQLMLWIDKVQGNGLNDPIVKYTDETDKNSAMNKQRESVMLTSNDPVFDQVKNLLQSTMTGLTGGSGKYKALSDVGIFSGQAVKYDMTYDGEPSVGYSTGNLEFYKNSSGNSSTNPLQNLFSSALTDLPNLNSLFNDATNGIFTKLGKVINDTIVFGTAGIIDKRIQGVGGLDSDKVHLSDKIDIEKKYVEEMREKLVDKYASLNMILAQFEYTSKYLESQFDSFNKK